MFMVVCLFFRITYVVPGFSSIIIIILVRTTQVVVAKPLHHFHHRFSIMNTLVTTPFFTLQADVVVRIQTPETSLDWNLPAQPYFTCYLLLQELINLRYSGVPIHLELSAETTEDRDTCVYMKQMLAQAPDENNLDWTITISDDIGQVCFLSIFKIHNNFSCK